jgi:predicted RecA/RadA family phage recombinase
MARNKIARGDVMDLAAPYDRTSGQGALVGSIFGVALLTVLSTVVGPFATLGVWELAKNSAEAWTVGARIYWDDTNKRCTTTSTSNTLIGVAQAVAANPSSVGRVRLNGSF